MLPDPKFVRFYVFDAPIILRLLNKFPTIGLACFPTLVYIFF